MRRLVSATGDRGVGSRKTAKLFNFASKTKFPRSPKASMTMMITEYGRTGRVEKAMKLFEEMPQKNQVSCNAMLSVLVDTGQLDSAVKLFDEMPQKNATSYTSMITGFSRSSLVPRARQLFDSIPSGVQNVFTWTAMISCYAQNNEPFKALELFSMLYGDFFGSRIIPNSYTFSALLKASGCIRSLSIARQTHSLIVKLLGVERKEAIFVQNSLIDIHAKLGNLVDAEMLFRRMRWKDVGSWNTMMDGYTHHLLVDKALKLFKTMREKDTLSWNIVMSGLLEGRRGEEALRLFLSLIESARDMKPNSSTYTIALTACATLTLLQFGKQIHAYIAKIGFYNSNTFVCNSLVSMYANCGLNNELEQIFDEMSNKDVISWNAVIQGLGQNGCSRKALEIAEKALDLNIYNCNTFIAVLTSCSHAGLISEGLNYFNSMSEKYGIEAQMDHYICVIDMLGRAGKLREAYDLLCNMPMAANSVAWSTLLNACLIHKNIAIARMAARELQALGTSFCSGSDDIEELKEVVDMIKEKNLRKQPGCSWVIEI